MFSIDGVMPVRFCVYGPSTIRVRTSEMIFRHILVPVVKVINIFVQGGFVKEILQLARVLVIVEVSPHIMFGNSIVSI